MFEKLFGKIDPDKPDGSMVGGKWYRRYNSESRIKSKHSNEHFWLMLDGIKLLDDGIPIYDFVRLYMRTTETSADKYDFQSVKHLRHAHAETGSCMLNKDGKVLLKFDENRQDDPFDTVPISYIREKKAFCTENRNDNIEFFEKFLFYINENGQVFTYVDSI